jgi:hypothetical protein
MGGYFTTAFNLPEQSMQDYLAQTILARLNAAFGWGNKLPKFTLSDNPKVDNQLGALIWGNNDFWSPAAPAGGGGGGGGGAVLPSPIAGGGGRTPDVTDQSVCGGRGEPPCPGICPDGSPKTPGVPCPPSAPLTVPSPPRGPSSPSGPRRGPIVI